jgi:hypothetical protein
MVAQRQSSVASQRESSLHDGSESLMHEDSGPSPHSYRTGSGSFSGSFRRSSPLDMRSSPLDMMVHDAPPSLAQYPDGGSMRSSSLRQRTPSSRIGSGPGLDDSGRRRHVPSHSARPSSLVSSNHVFPCRMPAREVASLARARQNRGGRHIRRRARAPEFCLKWRNGAVSYAWQKIQCRHARICLPRPQRSWRQGLERSPRCC